MNQSFKHEYHCSSRSGKVLQPQPDFQERELRKKRRLRKKSDLSKFDMSDLKKKLDVISQEEKEDSDNSLTSQGTSSRTQPNSRSSSSDSKNSAKTSDGGFYDESTGNSDSNSGASTPDKENGVILALCVNSVGPFTDPIRVKSITNSVVDATRPGKIGQLGR